VNSQILQIKTHPDCWRRKKIIVEVEAKAKEVAVGKLLGELRSGDSTESQR
jgi:hypothetical protein